MNREHSRESESHRDLRLTELRFSSSHTCCMSKTHTCEIIRRAEGENGHIAGGICNLASTALQCSDRKCTITSCYFLNKKQQYQYSKRFFLSRRRRVYLCKCKIAQCCCFCFHSSFAHKKLSASLTYGSDDSWVIFF